MFDIAKKVQAAFQIYKIERCRQGHEHITREEVDYFVHAIVARLKLSAEDKSCLRQILSTTNFGTKSHVTDTGFSGKRRGSRWITLV